MYIQRSTSKYVLFLLRKEFHNEIIKVVSLSCTIP